MAEDDGETVPPTGTPGGDISVWRKEDLEVDGVVRLNRRPHRSTWRDVENDVIGHPRPPLEGTTSPRRDLPRSSVASVLLPRSFAATTFTSSLATNDVSSSLVLAIRAGATGPSGSVLVAVFSFALSTPDGRAAAPVDLTALAPSGAAVDGTTPAGVDVVHFLTFTSSHSKVSLVVTSVEPSSRIVVVVETEAGMCVLLIVFVMQGPASTLPAPTFPVAALTVTTPALSSKNAVLFTNALLLLRTCLTEEGLRRTVFGKGEIFSVS